MRRLLVSLVLSAVTLAPQQFVAGVAAASPLNAANAANGASGASGATLSILAQPVEVASSDVDAFAAATPSQTLQAGAVVRTGPRGLALLTFFDGSETQLGPDSQVQIERASATPGLDIALRQTAGVTTNHVMPMQPGGGFQTDTTVAVALVRGTSYVVVVGNLPSHKPTDAPRPVTTVVLLADPSGRVGRVVVAPHAAAQPVELSKPGDVGASSAQAAAKTELRPSAVTQLQATTRDLHDLTSANHIGAQARGVVHVVTPVVAADAELDDDGKTFVALPTGSVDPALEATGDAQPVTTYSPTGLATGAGRPGVAPERAQPAASVPNAGHLPNALLPRAVAQLNEPVTSAAPVASVAPVVAVVPASTPAPIVHPAPVATPAPAPVVAVAPVVIVVPVVPVVPSVPVVHIPPVMPVERVVL